VGHRTWSTITTSSLGHSAASKCVSTLKHTGGRIMDSTCLPVHSTRGRPAGGGAVAHRNTDTGKGDDSCTRQH
jgi:hypothetical protein